MERVATARVGTMFRLRRLAARPSRAIAAWLLRPYISGLEDEHREMMERIAALEGALSRTRVRMEELEAVRHRLASIEDQLLSMVNAAPVQPVKRAAGRTSGATRATAPTASRATG